MNDYYSILGVERGASQESISKAWRKKAREYHPDVNPDDQIATEKFKEVTKAYEVLSDPQKRAMYDQQTGMSGFGGPMPGMFDNIFKRWAEFSGANEPVMQKGQSIRTSVDVTLKEVLTGAKKRVTITSRDPCSVCNGDKFKTWDRCGHCDGHGFITARSGAISLQAQCSACGGSGRMPKDSCDACKGTGFGGNNSHSVEIDIPKGVVDGVQIRLDGLGGKGRPGEPPGDLYVVVHVKSDKKFLRDKCNLTTRIDASYTQLVFGAEVDLETLTDTIKLKIPPRTKSGARLKVRGKGLPLIESPDIIGDLNVQVDLHIPKKLDEKVENLLKQLAELELNDSVKPDKEGEHGPKSNT